MLLRILAFVFIISGAILVYGAPWFVKRFKLDKQTICEFEDETTSEEELQKYKVNKAIVNFKMMGMVVLLPGLIMLIVSFR